MAFVAALPLAGGETVEVFLDPTPREWRELEAGVDPVDGLRAYLVGSRLYAWLPAVLHEEVAPALRVLLGEQPQEEEWLPLAVVPGLKLVNVTTSLVLGEDEASLQQRIEERVRRAPALARRFKDELLVRHSWRFRRAA